MSLLEIEGLTHAFGDNLLYRNAGFTLNKGEHIGIVGQNGAGKSTLIKICTGQIMPDAGRVIRNPKAAMGYLDQYAEIKKDITMEAFLKSAYEGLYRLEQEMLLLYEKAAYDEEALKLAAKYQERLEIQGFYDIDTRIGQVASGLGLSAIGLARPVGQMSGGQRAKVILAKLLLEKPDVLLLDEPTNFLDKEHIAWLSDYLAGLENAFMVVSHDYDFLEKIANRICDIDNKTIAKYYGTYSEFLKKKTLLREDYVRQYVEILLFKHPIGLLVGSGLGEARRRGKVELYVFKIYLLLHAAVIFEHKGIVGGGYEQNIKNAFLHQILKLGVFQV